MKDWDATLYREHTGFVSELGAPVVELLDPRSGERILDVGCGDGALTEKLVMLGCKVVAIDASEDMVNATRKRGVDARVLDAAMLVAETAYHGTFDAVFSNAALHWMHPMADVAQGIARCLKSGGRFVAEFGGEGNVAGIRSALHDALSTRGIPPENVDPWHFPSVREYTSLLETAGFEIDSVEHFARPTALPAGVGAWVESVARPFLRAVEAGERDDLLKEVEALLPECLRGTDGVWRADYVRLRVSAVKRAA